MFTYRATAVSLQVDTQLGPQKLKVTFRNTLKRIHTYCFKFFLFAYKKKNKNKSSKTYLHLQSNPCSQGEASSETHCWTIIHLKKMGPFASELVGSDYFAWIKNYWKIESVSLIIKSRKAIF